MVAESPRFFTLGDPDDDGEEEAFCNMVHAEDEEDEMQQDGGMSSLDKRRKNMSPKSRTSALSESEWEQVSPVRSHGYSSSEVPAMPWKKEDTMVAIEEVVIETKNVKVFTVESIAEVIPKNFPDMTVRDLAMECLKWGVQVSGNKGELQDRLRDLYQGKAILQKGCSKKFVRLEESRQLHPQEVPQEESQRRSLSAHPQGRGKEVSGYFEVPDPRFGLCQRRRRLRCHQGCCRRRPWWILEHSWLFRMVWRWAGSVHRSLAVYVAALWSFVATVKMEDCSLDAAISLESPSVSSPGSLMKVWKHCGDSMSPMVQWHDTRRTKGVSLPLAIACMVEGEAKNSEHEDEPNQDAMQPTLDKNSKENVSQEGHLALLDTACTACMHSKAWREAHERSLPEDEKCIPTPHRKTFHFANGDSTENKVTVWKIPIYVGGFKGEVYSAEMPKGNTPLLLSIAAMTALDMVVFLRRKVVMVGKLNIELPLINTHTNHLAIDVAYDQKLGIQNASQVKIAEPRFVSEKEDLLVYYGEEAKVFLLEGLWMPEASYEEDRGGTPDHGLRGVRAQDERSFVATRRGNELEKASRRIRGEDRRTWVALRRSYSVAEELALRQFESTAIFEPFGGTFGVTRMAAEKFGWTNSQPLDLVDGYDLLKKAGRELVARTLEEHDPFLTVIAFDCRIWSLMCNMNHTIDWEALRSSIGRETIRLVRWICWHRHQRGRYYLVENPAGSAAWEFDRLREELREKAGGKFIISDQCRYGLKDSQSGRPIKKPTGWASNAEVLLNHLGKKCRCRWGEHEHLLGSNRDGPRAKRAASYPTGLCTAICQGALETMRLDYAIYMSGVNAAFPVEDEDEEMPLFDDREEGQPEQSSAEEDMARDAWRLNGNTLRRIHVVPRCRLFTPLRATDPPVEVEKIGPTRKTQMKKADGSVQIHEDLWAEPHPDFTETDYLWTGHTEFQLVEVEERRPDEEAEPVEEAAEKDEEVKRDRGLLKRRRARTRQLQRGLWVVEEDEAVKERLQATLELMNEQDVHNWMSLEKGSELFEAWASAESAQAEVQLILCSRKARRMRKPQPFAGPAEVPLRKGFLLLENSVLCTYWETWTQLAPQAQIRPLVAEGRQLYVVMFGKELGDHLEVEKDDRYMAKEQERMRRWNALPRELKLAGRGSMSTWGMQTSRVC